MTDLKLRLKSNHHPDRIISVAQDDFIIGRLPECDLPLPFGNVSRRHTRIKRLNDQWYIEDLGSTNGTVLNQFTLTSPQPLHHGDRIEIGKVSLGVILKKPTISRVTHIPGPTLDSERSPDEEGKTTIVRDLQQLQEQWIHAESDDPLSTHQTALARLRDLVEIAKKLNQAESIEAIFAEVKSIIFRELITIERLALMVDFNENQELEMVKAAARDFPDDHPLVQRSSWISQSVCNRVFHEKISLKSVDAQMDQRFQGEHSILMKGIRGVLAAPLWDQDQVVGVLYADAHLRLQDSEKIEDEDLSFFSTLASLMASSVQRWLLTRKLQAQAQIRQRLERYHSPSVVQQMISVGALEDGRLPPIEADISILFADIVGFTALSERLPPRDLALLLNTFFEEMLVSVFDAGGTLDKFIGDCIMAFFGAPEPQKNHAQRAVISALGMLDRLERLNAKNILEHPLQLRIAINSGKAFVGDVGSSQRVDYTVLGPTVNLASRMEAVCPPGECVISEDTYRALKKPKLFVPMGVGRFKGIDRPVRIYRTNRHPHRKKSSSKTTIYDRHPSNPPNTSPDPP